MSNSSEDSGWPAWVVMWAVAFGIYFLLKVLSLWARMPLVSWNRCCFIYLIGWPGMDADSFLQPSKSVNPPPIFEWLSACIQLLIGLSVFYGILPLIRSVDPYCTAWTRMIGFVTFLHFGLFHLLSCLWRAFGFEAAPIMNGPILSTSLSEFWGARWNRAFRDLTHRFLFRPLKPLVGAKAALITGFIVSGLIHDLVISVPAKGGYGLPTGYFVLQGLAILLEKSSVGRFCGLGKGFMGRLYCGCATVLPAGMLFHHAFADRVIVPFLEAVGALK